FFHHMEDIHRWRLLWPILSVRGLSNARTPRCCWAFYGVGLRFASSARCPMTSPIGSGPGDTAFNWRKRTRSARVARNSAVKSATRPAHSAAFRHGGLPFGAYLRPVGLHLGAGQSGGQRRGGSCRILIIAVSSSHAIASISSSCIARFL